MVNTGLSIAAKFDLASWEKRGSSRLNPADNQSRGLLRPFPTELRCAPPEASSEISLLQFIADACTPRPSLPFKSITKPDDHGLSYFDARQLGTAILRSQAAQSVRRLQRPNGASASSRVNPAAYPRRLQRTGFCGRLSARRCFLFLTRSDAQLGPPFERSTYFYGA